jgi:hypothetical protein
MKLINDYIDFLDKVSEPFAKEAKFHPEKCGLIGPGLLYRLFSKKIDKKVKVSMDDFSHVYFISEDNKLDFRIHVLEFNDTDEWLYWQRVSLEEKEARLKGIYIRKTFYGSVSSKGRYLDVISKDLRIVDLRTEKQRIKDNRIFHEIMYTPLSNCSESEKMPSK